MVENSSDHDVTGSTVIMYHFVRESDKVSRDEVCRKEARLDVR